MLDVTMGNHAGNPFVLGWIIGAIDGEGTITLSKANRSGTYYKPEIKLANTDTAFIQRCVDYLNVLGIPHWVGSSIPTLRGVKYRRVYTVAIQGFKRVRSALQILKPELFANKAKQAQLVLQITESRLSTPMTEGDKGRGFTARELHLLEQLREANRRGKYKSESSEAMSKAGLIRLV